MVLKKKCRKQGNRTKDGKKQEIGNKAGFKNKK